MSPRAGRPPKTATAAFDAELERLRRLTGLRVDTLARAVQGLADADGWARLTQLGTVATVEAQQAAVTAVTEYLTSTLVAAGVPSGGISVPILAGLTVSGRPVSGMFAATEGIVRNRMAGGDTFDEALDHSTRYLVGQSASEPHRIGRDGQFAAGLHDERFDRFRRIAEAGACDWCRMLVTRGAVYLTAQTAGKYRRYHDLCRCAVELVVSAEAVHKSIDEGAKAWSDMAVTPSQPAKGRQTAFTVADSDALEQMQEAYRQAAAASMAGDAAGAEQLRQRARALAARAYAR